MKSFSIATTYGNTTPDERIAFPEIHDQAEAFRYAKWYAQVTEEWCTVLERDGDQVVKRHPVSPDGKAVVLHDCE